MNNNWKVLLYPLLGSLISAVAFILDINITVWLIKIRPVHIIIWLIWLNSIEIIVRTKLYKISQFTPISIGLSIGTVVGYMINNGSFIGPISNIHYIFLSGILGSILIGLSLKGRSSRKLKIVKTSNVLPFLWSTLMLFTIVSNRIFNIINRDIPNEDRSLIISGIEVHHFIIGIIIICLAQTIIYNFTPPKILVMILLGLLVIGQSLIADQLTYIVMFPLNDDAFFSWFSIIGAMFGLCWFVLKMFSINWSEYKI